MYVLVATPTGRGGKGGIARIMDSLSQALRQRNDEALKVRYEPTRGTGNIFISPYYLIRFCLLIVWLRSINRLDLLHINIASRGSTYRKVLIAMLARLLKVPYVLHLHGAQYRDFWDGRGPILDKAITAMFSHAARVFVLGNVWRDYIASKVAKQKDKIVILPNASPLTKRTHTRANDLLVILFLGRLCERKGIIELIDALSQIASLKGWQAILAGDGDIDWVRKKINERGLDERVSIPGWLGAVEVKKFITNADILTLPSYDENLPMSVIEGMAAGLAIVATPVGAVEDIIIDDETGLLVPVGNSAALAKALTKLLENSNLRRELGEKAAAFHRAHLDINEYAKQISKLWRESATG